MHRSSIHSIRIVKVLSDGASTSTFTFTVYHIYLYMHIGKHERYDGMIKQELVYVIQYSTYIWKCNFGRCSLLQQQVARSLIKKKDGKSTMQNPTRLLR